MSGRLIALLVLVPSTALAVGPQDETPPPMRDTPQESAELPAGLDVIETSDGRTHRGRILSELQHGFLFHEDDGTTFVIPYGTVVDMQRARDLYNAPPVVVQPAPQPVRTVVSPSEAAARVLVSPEYAARKRSVPLAYVLELLVPGAGHIYAGAVGEGITHLLLVTLLPGVILGGLAVGGVALYVLNPDVNMIPQVVTGLLINFLIILVAAVLSARVASVMRAGPAATTYNQRLLGEMIVQEEQ